MKYFILDINPDEDIIGCYPQCKGLPSGYTVEWFKKTNSMTKLTNREFPSEQPDLLFELEDDAYLTDVIIPTNLQAKGFLVSQRLKDLISKFNITKHQFYSAKIQEAKSLHIYYWLHFVEDYQIFDFRTSHFIIKKRLEEEEYGKVYFENEFDFMEKRIELAKEEKYVVAMELYLTKNAKNVNYDLIYAPYLNNNRVCLISQRLIDEITKYDITGFRFLDQTFFYA